MKKKECAPTRPFLPRLHHPRSEIPKPFLGKTRTNPSPENNQNRFSLPQKPQKIAIECLQRRKQFTLSKKRKKKRRLSFKFPAWKKRKKRVWIEWSAEVALACVPILCLHRLDSKHMGVNGRMALEKTNFQVVSLNNPRQIDSRTRSEMSEKKRRWVLFLYGVLVSNLIKPHNEPEALHFVVAEVLGIEVAPFIRIRLSKVEKATMNEVFESPSG